MEETTKQVPFYKKKWIWVVAILFLVVAFSSNDSSTSDVKSEVVPAKEVSANKQAVSKEKSIIPYEIIDEGDTSYSGCSRNDYSIIVSNDVSQDELEDALLDLYDKKNTLSDKIFIFAYTESQRAVIDNTLYKGRLFMDPNCDNSNEYKVDFDYWDVDLEALKDTINE